MAANPEPETLLTRAWRFGRALIVGSGATLTDFSIFTTCVRAIDIAPTTARLPALLAGACVRFVGNRSFTFRAQAGSLPRQVTLFLVAEAITLNLRWLADRVARATLHVSLREQAPPEVVVSIEPEPKFFPGLRVPLLIDFGSQGEQVYYGGGISLRFFRALSFDLHVLKRSGSEARGPDALTASVGGEIYSNLLGNGQRAGSTLTWAGAPAMRASMNTIKPWSVPRSV